jgi:hypothetical protein
MMTREEAKALGLKRYFGEPCPKAHYGERFVSSKECCTCSALRQKAKHGKQINPFGQEVVPPKTMAERVIKKRKSGIPLPKLKEAAVTPLLVGLTDLSSNGCHYPYGDTSDYRFCGLPKMQATPNCPMPAYCPEHFALCTVPWRRVPKGLSIPSSLAA